MNDINTPCVRRSGNGMNVPLQPGTEAEILNRECYCVSLDQEALRRELAAQLGAREASAPLLETHPHLFASLPVFVSRRHVSRMAEIIEAVESVVAKTVYRDAVLQWAPPIAGFDPGSCGVFLGYDFHLGPVGPQLIEINTNAGGALLNAMLGRAQQACCKAIERLVPGPDAFVAFEADIIAMFRDEWRLQRGSGELARVAIVDDHPGEQYLYPEFLLFQQLFRRSGIDAVIADPGELTLRDGAIWHNGLRIDLVYNRLTDFALAAPANAALRDAYLSGQVVLTPHPRAHALYADKRNLSVLTDAARLHAWGVDDAMVSTLVTGIPRTRVVNQADADEFWSDRRKLFFKPATGFGSKAAYRGEKLTKRVWEEVLTGSYVAQAFVPPSQRQIRDAASPLALKLDVRNYVYNGAVQLLAARLYQGQTTNFRTPGGGFAPVFTSPTEDASLYATPA
jgi:hypothetical protein